MFRKVSKYIAALVLILTWSAVAEAQTLSAVTLTVSGAEQSLGGVWDSGSVTVTVNGYTRTYSGLSGYGRYSDVGSVASLIAVHLSEDTSAPVWAKSTGSVITMVGRAGEKVTVSATTAYDTAHFGGPSFTFSSGTTSVTPTPYLSLHCTRSTMGTGQTANCVAEIDGASTLYGASAPTNAMAFTVNSASWVSVPTGTDGTATAIGFSEGSAGTYTVRADYPGDSYYSAMHATATITVGSAPSTTSVYSYSITNSSSGSGYDSAGNITAYSDSINGQWILGYDAMNRLSAASSSPAIQSGTPYLCWSYDSFGNRKQQYLGSSAFSGGGTSACSGGGSITTTNDQGYASNNRMTTATHPSTSFGYDDAGNITSDSGNGYAYDAEERLCASGDSSSGYTGYLYDAEGRRVAKGSISSLDCSLVNGDSFTVTESYVIGPDGSTMTELDGSGNWKHTDVPTGPGAMAVYDGDGLHFRFSDWLGSHRVQTDYAGVTPAEDSYRYLPFGELTGSSAGATEKLFTGKERDAESGNDFFEARYYSSPMGRFMSPDWAKKPEAIPYSNLQFPQSLNLYTYSGNSPIGNVDSNGHSVDYQRVKAIRIAWEQERNNVMNGGSGSRNWTAAERRELIQNGRVFGYEGHHINSVKTNPQMAGDPDNIEFLTRDEHFEAHGFNWRFATVGSLLSRSLTMFQMLDILTQSRIAYLEEKITGISEGMMGLTISDPSKAATTLDGLTIGIKNDEGDLDIYSADHGDFYLNGKKADAKKLKEKRFKIIPDLEM